MGDMFDRGLKLRREVLGAEYVDNSLKSANEFMMAFQHITTEWCWGYALGKAPEIKLHVRGAINNGLSVDDIKEVLLHATVYCGIPAGLDAFKAANDVLKEMGKMPAGGAKA